MTNEEELIPGLIEYRNNGNSVSIEDWTIYEGNIQLAIGYSKLFWPDFTEYDGCVFFKSRFNQANFENWKKTSYVKNYGQIESVLNHIHVLDLFGSDKKKDEVTYSQIKFLGNKLRDIFAAKLRIDFPGRQFIVHFNGDDINNELDEYELTFYQDDNLQRQIKNGT